MGAVSAELRVSVCLLTVRRTHSRESRPCAWADSNTPKRPGGGMPGKISSDTRWRLGNTTGISDLGVFLSGLLMLLDINSRFSA